MGRVIRKNFVVGVTLARAYVAKKIYILIDAGRRS